MALPRTKRDRLLDLLADGMVLVRLDARRPGVKVPPAHASDPDLALNLSYRFASRDLEVGPEGISCTLSFSGALFRCELPLSAIHAAASHVTGVAYVWPEALAGEPLGEPPRPRRRRAAAHPRSPRLEEQRPEAAPERRAPARLERRAHLRLVK